MPDPLVTPITPPRVAFLDPRTGNVSREWYLFFLSLFQLTGGSNVSLGDVQKGPPPVTVDEINQTIDSRGNDLEPSQDGLLDQVAQLAQQVQDLQAQLQNCCDALEQQKEIEGLQLEPRVELVEPGDQFQPQPELGSMSSVQQDNVRFLGFSLDPSPAVAFNHGEIAWDNFDQTLSLGMDYGVVQQIGMEYYARVENATGVTIDKGAVVGFAGVGSSNTLSVAPYLADGSTPSLYILGVMAHDLPNSGEVGYCTVWGHVTGIDTTGTPVSETWNVGDVLYANPTTAGAFTNVKPTAPDNVIPVAAVLAVDATDGAIFVRPTIEQQQYYGEFTKTGASTVPASANTSYAITWDNTEIANGISIVSSSQLTVVESGLYQFDVTLQLQSNSGTDKNVRFWFKKNGTNIPNTTRIVTVSVNTAYTPLALSDFFSLAAGDYIELWWQSDNTNVALVTVAAGGTAPNDYPAAPAAVIAVSQIQL